MKNLFAIVLCGLLFAILYLMTVPAYPRKSLILTKPEEV